MKYYNSFSFVIPALAKQKREALGILSKLSFLRKQESAIFFSLRSPSALVVYPENSGRPEKSGLRNGLANMKFTVFESTVQFIY
ncbi:MAG: hypothetical protein LWX07_11840 [Bacteroidetes bacterium]|nr:hypothetical protein [Bacteroidota bacterium]